MSSRLGSSPGSGRAGRHHWLRAGGHASFSVGPAALLPPAEVGLVAPGPAPARLGAGALDFRLVIGRSRGAPLSAPFARVRGQRALVCRGGHGGALDRGGGAGHRGTARTAVAAAFDAERGSVDREGEERRDSSWAWASLGCLPRTNWRWLVLRRAHLGLRGPHHPGPVCTPTTRELLLPAEFAQARVRAGIPGPCCVSGDQGGQGGPKSPPALFSASSGAADSHLAVISRPFAPFRSWAVPFWRLLSFSGAFVRVLTAVTIVTIFSCLVPPLKRP